MNRMHIHVNVTELDRSIEFYSTLFGTQPSVQRDDYAKWLMDDPAVNFAISTGGCDGEAGLSHLGIQSDEREGLDRMAKRLQAAGAKTVQQESTSCCYAVSDKTWVQDPTGLQWETFYTHGESAIYGEDEARKELVELNRESCG